MPDQPPQPYSSGQLAMIRRDWPWQPGLLIFPKNRDEENVNLAENIVKVNRLLATIDQLETQLAAVRSGTNHEHLGTHCHCDRAALAPASPPPKDAP